MAATLLRKVRHNGDRIMQDAAPSSPRTETTDGEVVAQFAMVDGFDFHTEIADGLFRLVRCQRKPSALDATGKNPAIVAANARRRAFWQKRRSQE